jgi:hypothetical protein
MRRKVVYIETLPLSRCTCCNIDKIYKIASFQVALSENKRKVNADP